MYKQYCYDGCPSIAPYVYETYCRNCLKDYCLLCNYAGLCVMCFNNYFLLEGDCLSSCPQNYEPDSLTHISCVETASAALLSYLAVQ